MANIEQLKRRIELVAERMATAQAARTHENERLKSQWEAVHGRFEEQNAEIDQLREQVNELTGDRENLVTMLQGLLAAVEADLELVSGETSPILSRLSSAAGVDALSKPSGALPPAPVPEDLHAAGNDDEDRSDDDFLAAIERSLQEADLEEDLAGSEAILMLEDADDPISIPSADERGQDVSGEEVAIADSPDELSFKPLSPGIRDLVKRLEGVTLDSVGRDSTDSAKADAGFDDDAREIEILRDELMGLRDNIAKSS
jgi:hypothetical protein